MLDGRKKYYLISIFTLICLNRKCKIFENRSTDKVFMAKMISIGKGEKP